MENKRAKMTNDFRKNVYKQVTNFDFKAFECKQRTKKYVSEVDPTQLMTLTNSNMTSENLTKFAVYVPNSE